MRRHACDAILLLLAAASPTCSLAPSARGRQLLEAARQLHRNRTQPQPRSSEKSGRTHDLAWLAPCLRKSDHPDCPGPNTPCFAAEFQGLYKQSCMRRIDMNRTVRTSLSWVPFYVTHAPWLTVRRNHILGQLGRIGAQDVTLVLCANGDEIGHLSPRARLCIHPWTMESPWKRPGYPKNGSLSLTLKHMLAMHDMLHRRLPAAIVLEDDAEFAADFPDRFMQLLAHVPLDAAFFYLGSYSRHNGHLGQYPKIYPYYKNNSANLVRLRTDSDGIYGTIGYAVFESGARQLIRPVLEAADVQFSWQKGPYRAPQISYGPDRFIVWPSAGLGIGTHLSKPPAT